MLRRRPVWTAKDFAEHCGIGRKRAVRWLRKLDTKHGGQLLIPLCHQIPLSKVAVEFELQADGILITATTKTVAQTGVEMEALTAVSLAALTIYDMCKAVDKTMTITEVHLVSKTKVAGFVSL